MGYLEEMKYADLANAGADTGRARSDQHSGPNHWPCADSWPGGDCRARANRRARARRRQRAARSQRGSLTGHAA